MKLTYGNIALTLFLTLSAIALKAQQSALGPHGGRLKTIGNYKIELLGCDNYLELYLFDKDTDAINNDNITGNVVFYYSGSANLSSPLVHYGMDGFTARIPVNTFIYSKPLFDMGSQFYITVKFDNECLIKK